MGYKRACALMRVYPCARDIDGIQGGTWHAKFAHTNSKPGRSGSSSPFVGSRTPCGWRPAFGSAIGATRRPERGSCLAPTAKNVLTYDEAAEAARKLARAGPGEEAGDRPATVSEAIESYRLDLIARDAQPENADRILVHIPPAISQRPVAMLTAKEVRAWRNGLVDKGLTRASANRYMKSLAACLTLAAKLDSRIANSAAWKVSALPDATEARNVILSDVQVRTVVEASYKINIAFGTLAEVLAVLGVRPSQAKRLRVGDLNADHPDGPQLEMPCSKKGSGVKRIARVPLPIPQVLARRVAAAAVGRPDSDPLLLDPAGNEWTSGGHVQPFAQAAAAAGLPEGTTIYSLRHSSIVRSLLLGTPTRLVAASHDTSVSQIEAHYSKYITTPGAALMRRAAEALKH